MRSPGRRWWLGVALLLSLGFNLGLLAAMAGVWWGHGGGGHGGTAGHHGDHRPVHAGGDHPGDLGTEFRPGEEGLTTLPGDSGLGDEQLRRHMPPLDRMADHLGLQGEKRDRFLELQRELFTGIARARLERRALTRELYVELGSDEPDRQRVDSLLAELSRLHTEAERRTAEGILETRSLLDDDEQQRYLNVVRRLHHHGGPGPGHRRPGRRGPGGRRP